MIHHQPLVSVLMTAYNRQDFIEEAINSVLSSSYSNWELIISDDCSLDKTIEIARQYELQDKRIKVYTNEKNLGDYSNRNKASSHAKGKYIKFADADDVQYYFGMDVAVNFTEQFPEAGFGLGAVPDQDKPFPIFLKPREIYLEHFFGHGHFDRAPSSGLIKKAAFEKVGGFSGKRMIGDYEFWLKIARYYPMVKLPIDTYWNRLHANQESQTDYAKKNYDRLRKEVLKEALANPDCPLTIEDLNLIKKRTKEIETKNLLLKSLGRIRKMIP